MMNFLTKLFTKEQVIQYRKGCGFTYTSLGALTEHEKSCVDCAARNLLIEKDNQMRQYLYERELEEQQTAINELLYQETVAKQEQQQIFQSAVHSRMLELRDERDAK